MSAFGAAISPVWYKDTTNHFYSKREVLNHLHRALVTVGMIPNDAMSTFSNFESVNDAQFDAVDGVPHYQVYDYPDSASYTVDGVAYRPILVMVNFRPAATYDWATPPYNGKIYWGHMIGLVAARRRADRSNFSDVATMELLGPGYGATGGGVWDGGNYTSGYSTLWYHKSGCFFAQDSMMQTAASAATTNPSSNKRININNIHVILSPAGLYVFMGTHATRKQECGDMLSFGCVFHGGRIPGRGLPTIQDTALGHIDPVVLIPFDNSVDGTGYDGPYANGADTRTSGYMQSGTYFNGRLGEVGPSSWALGAEHGLYSSASCVRMLLMSVDSADAQVLTDFGHSSIPYKSPRAISGAGYNILNRVCAFSWQVWNHDGTEYVGPIDRAIRFEPLPQWHDMWYLAGFRFSDAYAAAGEYTDAGTSKHWWMQYAFNTKQMYGIDVTGITKLTTLAI